MACSSITSYALTELILKKPKHEGILCLTYIILHYENFVRLLH